MKLSTIVMTCKQLNVNGSNSVKVCLHRGNIAFGVEIVRDNELMDLGMHTWHPPKILQGRITSSPTWQRRESLGSRSLNALPDL